MTLLSTIPVALFGDTEFEDLGYLPEFLNELDPRPAVEQLHENYQHGGGWQPFKGFTFHPADKALSYEGDPNIFPLAMFLLREERIYLYPHGWVAIVQPDNSTNIARMD